MNGDVDMGFPAVPMGFPKAESQTRTLAAKETNRDNAVLEFPTCDAWIGAFWEVLNDEKPLPVHFDCVQGTWHPPVEEGGFSKVEPGKEGEVHWKTSYTMVETASEDDMIRAWRDMLKPSFECFTTLD